jgi:hypothetical protein
VQLKTRWPVTQFWVAPLVLCSRFVPHDNAAVRIIAPHPQLVQEKLFGQMLFREPRKEGTVPGDLPEARRLDQNVRRNGHGVLPSGESSQTI